MEVLLGGVIAEEIADGGRDDVRRRFELRVQGVEEVMAVARVELPRVLAVEGDDREVVLVTLLLAYALQTTDQAARGVDGGHALVVEADRVRDLRVPEDHRERLALALDAERLVELVRGVDAAFVIA